MSERLNDELERKILADPADPTGYLVYADWFQAHGHPRGELMAIQHALDREASREETRALRHREAEIFAKHRDFYLGELATWSRGLDCERYHRFTQDLVSYLGPTDNDVHIQLWWRWGFVHEVRLHIYENMNPGAWLKPVLEARSLRFLNRLILTDGEEDPEGEPVFGRESFDRLRMLEQWNEIGAVQPIERRPLGDGSRHARRAMAAFYAGALDECELEWETALHHHRSMEFRSQGELTAVANLGQFVSSRGRLEEAEQILDKAIELATFNDNDWFLCYSRNCLASLLKSAGRLEEANHQFEGALEAATRANHRAALGSICIIWADLKLDLGEVEDAEDLALRGQETLLGTNDRQQQGWSYITLGNIALEKGKIEDARAMYEQAHEHFDHLNDARSLATSTSCLAFVAQLEGRKRKARTGFKKAIRLSEDADDLLSEGRHRAMYGAFAALSGYPKEAEPYFVDAKELLETSGDVQGLQILAACMAVARGEEPETEFVACVEARWYQRMSTEFRP